MNQSKIAMLVTNEFRPDPRVLKEAESLSRAGFQVRVFAWDRLGKSPETEAYGAVTVRRVHVNSSYAAGSRQLFYLPRYWKRAVAAMTNWKPDVVHCHDLDTMPAGYLYARRHGTPLIFDAHECYPEQMRRQVGPLVYRVLLVLERFMARRATAVITVGQLLAGRFRRLGAKNVGVVGNYQPLGQYEATTAANRADYEVSNDRLLVAYIGGFTRERLLVPLIEATSVVDGVTALFAGDGQQRQAVEAAIINHPSAKYVGWLPLEDVRSLTLMADVIYYGLRSGEGNSRYSMPNALFNALAAGKPILTTKFGEIARIVAEESCGLVVDDTRAESLALALKKLKDAELRKEMAIKSANAARSSYNWAVAENSLLKVYDSIS